MSEKKLLHEWLIVISRDGQIEVIPFEDANTPEGVDKYFERVSEQWSGVYLCKVIRGPLKI